MDQIKTGRFIAAERKRQGRTQRQLAEALGISDKTVSKWECGNGFPEVSLLLPLCQALEVSVNELLTGAAYPIRSIGERRRIIWWIWCVRPRRTGRSCCCPWRWRR